MFRVVLAALVPAIVLGALVATQVRQAHAATERADVVAAEADELTAAIELLSAVRIEGIFIESRLAIEPLGFTNDVVFDLTGIDLEESADQATARTDSVLAGVTAEPVARVMDGVVSRRDSETDLPRLRRAYDVAEETILDAIERDADSLRRSASVLDGSADIQANTHVLAELSLIDGSARQQLGRYFELITTADPAVYDRNRLELAAATMAVDDARVRLRSSSPEWAVRLDDVFTTPGAERFRTLINASLDADSATVPSLDLEQLSRLGDVFAMSIERNDAIVDLVREARDRILLDAQEVGDAARHAMITWLVVSAAVVALSAVIVVWISLSITRPLRRLERQAALVNDGHLRVHELVDRGPREVAVVGRALHSLVRNLADVQERADLLTSGELDRLGDETLVRGPLGRTVGVTVEKLGASIRENEERRRRLEYEATHDDLTGLLNRAGVLDRLAATIDSELHTPGSLAVLFVDLDGFKQINDSHGHSAGDAVLIEVADRLVRVTRDGATAGRMGGDEFVMIAWATDGPGAEALGERIVDELCTPYLTDGQRAVIGASVGIAVAHGGEDVSTLLTDADLALYRAKSLGKGRVERYRPALREGLDRRRGLERDLRHALDDDEFSLHYQPIVDASDHAVRGFEALLRWNKPGVGSIPPMEFIPTAEKSSLIVDIGRWVIDRSLLQLSLWSGSPAMNGVSVSVNVSGRQLVGHDFVNTVRSSLARHRIDPHRLILELTENVLIEDGAAERQVLNTLRADGVRIAIDDYGTGHTSFTQLQRLPVDIVKVDRSFTEHVDDPTRGALAALMVEAGRALGISVVAEGIERFAQADRLREIGCDQLQGFLLARPAAPDAVESWMVGRMSSPPAADDVPVGV